MITVFHGPRLTRALAHVHAQKAAHGTVIGTDLHRIPFSGYHCANQIRGSGPDEGASRGITVLQSFSRVMLATCVIATGYAISPMVSSAGANQVQLHELLFNRVKRERVRQQRRGVVQQAPRPQAAPAPKRIRKVASESYYTYEPVALQTVALAALLPDFEQTGSIAVLAAQSAQVEIPPMMMLDPVAPTVDPAPIEAPATTAGGTELPPMLLLDPVAPQIAETENRGSTIEVPQALSLEPAPVQLASSDYFAVGVQQDPESTLRIEADVADAVRAIYAERKDFLWSDGQEISENAKAVMAMLADADAHGLDADHYAVDMPTLGGQASDRARALVAFDVSLTARAARFARDLKDGMVDPNKLSGYHDFKDERLSADAAITGLASADDASVWLSSLAPQQPDYAKLQAELAALATEVDDSVTLPEKIMMKPGSTDDALPLVMKAIERKLRDETRAKHAAVFDTYAGSTLYEGEVVDLIKDVQRDLGLVPDGIVGPATAARLGGDSVQSRIDKVKFAMERLRWHPEHYGDRQVVINSPEYRVRYIENGETSLAMNAVVGKLSNQTYFFHDEIETVVFNPYWGVPQSIIVNSYLPKLHRDPSYLDRNGFVVTSHSGKRISSSAINWRQFSGPVPYNVRQKPGPRNALGELKILFPNEHAIYMHDTPAKELFGRDARAYSHGCVRLEDPRAMAAAVLGKDVEYVRSQLGGYERAEKVTADIPVYVGYFTAWPNDAGTIGYHPDVYKRDAHLKKAVDTIDATRQS